VNLEQNPGDAIVRKGLSEPRLPRVAQ